MLEIKTFCLTKNEDIENVFSLIQHYLFNFSELPDT